MLQSARAFLRRLGGSGEERRGARRHAANVETICRTVGTMGEWSARIRDVSRTGISLVVPHFLSAGTLIRVDLPVPTDAPHTTVLACVMYCREISEGQKVLGCVFSLELSETEVKQFGGMKKEAEPSDQRAWVRYPTRGTVHYTLVGDEHSHIYAAELADISPAGVGLILSTKVEPGLSITIKFACPDGTMRSMLACIVYLAERPDSKWAAGCHFLRELEDQELDKLVTRLSA